MDYTMILDKTMDVFMECNITSFPIDCFSLLEHYGFRIFNYSEIQKRNPDLYKMCCTYSNDAFQYKKIICYNEKSVMGRIRFSLMHELGHYILKHREESLVNEKEADIFASNILAPRIVVHTEQYFDADKIHDAFGLSYSASNRVLFDYWKRFQQNNILEIEHKLKLCFYPELEKKKTKERIHLEERSQFMEEFCYIHGEDIMFRVAEQQWLYGFL